ncbi:hypothetical protein DFP72DRAFT_1077669 [Ephemerocybe angulata]|uniref:Uncharacterized protein n=1 Tax=Ephemerocybe angulata TaxID=980116 RepID=A0A8H6LX47_9AGAR|nr:hypothetical protein DFP72DRAFT_1077669 [Tulosesus angulatus]
MSRPESREGVGGMSWPESREGVGGMSWPESREGVGGSSEAQDNADFYTCPVLLRERIQPGDTAGGPSPSVAEDLPLFPSLLFDGPPLEALSTYQWFNKDGELSPAGMCWEAAAGLATPTKDPPKDEGPPSETEEDEVPPPRPPKDEGAPSEGKEDAVPPPLAGTKRPRGRRAGKKKSRGGVDHRGPDPQESKRLSLYKHHTSRADYYISDLFSAARAANRTYSGWMGRNPPATARDEINRRYKKGTLGECMGEFQLIPAARGHRSATILLDREGRAFLVRTSPATWLEARAEAFWSAVSAFMKAPLEAEEAQGKARSRGKHLPVILGYYRPYTPDIKLAEFHSRYPKEAEVFISTPIIRRLVGWASSLVWLYFPNVAKRYRACGEWHREHSKQGPQFGLFWNLCINGILVGERRVHCEPHADWKNIVGVCIVIVYQIPGTAFDHTKKSWLCIWEAGVCLELPPWVAVEYPSSLFYHFNVDIDGIKIVTTNGEQPTPGDVDECYGRGSLVFFNQASMFQSSETGFPTLKAAREAGEDTTRPFSADIRAAFETHAVYRALPT